MVFDDVVIESGKQLRESRLAQSFGMILPQRSIQRDESVAVFDNTGPQRLFRAQHRLAMTFPRTQIAAA